MAAGGDRHRLWNHSQILELLASYRNIVIAYFAGLPPCLPDFLCLFFLTMIGHYHTGGYGLQDGIHHITIPSILEAPLGVDVPAAVLQIGTNWFCLNSAAESHLSEDAKTHPVADAARTYLASVPWGTCFSF